VYGEIPQKAPVGLSCSWQILSTVTVSCSPDLGSLPEEPNTAVPARRISQTTYFPWSYA